MAAIKIENGPPPPRDLIYYPWQDMKVNQSFFEPFGDEEPKKVLGRLASAAYRAGRRLDRRFSCRVIHEEGGVRVWRVE